MTTPAPSVSARAVFGDRLPLAVEFAALLTTEGVTRGVIGPREVSRLWDRHLVNCAVVEELLPSQARVVDVGSGAGLPGVALAIARPDLVVDLVDSLGRRTAFLDDVVTALGLGEQVRVVQGRAEDAAIRSKIGGVQWVTARAVAPLDRLVRWCLPLLLPGGCLLALKGATVQAEITTHEAEIARLGGSTIDVVECGGRSTGTPTTVAMIRRTAHAARKANR